MVKNFRVRTKPSVALPRGMYAGVVMVLLLLPTFLLSNWDSLLNPPCGIWVGISPASRIAALHLNEEPIVICVVFTDTQLHYIVNHREVQREQLGSALKEELARHADWTVYLDADVRLGYTDAVDAMEVIQRLHARVVLVTPNNRSLVNDVASNTASRK